MTKMFYETPTTKTLVVRFQGVLCGSQVPTGEKVSDQEEWSGSNEWY